MGNRQVVEVLVVSRMLEKDKLRGFCCVMEAGETSEVVYFSLKRIRELVMKHDIEFINAEYSFESDALIGTEGSLTSYPVVNRDYMITSNKGVIVSHIILAKGTDKPIGVVCYNGTGARSNLLFSSLKSLLDMGNVACNFTMRNVGVHGVIPVKKSGGMFPTVEMTDPRSTGRMYNSAAGESATEGIDYNNVVDITKTDGKTMPKITVVNVNAITDSEFNKDGQSKLLVANIALADLTPYYHTVLSALNRIFIDQHQTLAVSETTIYIDLGFISRISTSELIFILIHEVLHVVMMCSARLGNRNHKLWNIANDIYVNELICKEFGIRQIGVEQDLVISEPNGSSKTIKICAPSSGWYLSSINETLDINRESPESIYLKLEKENPVNGGNGKSKSGKSNSGGSNTQTPEQKQHQQDVEKAIEEMRDAIQNARRGLKNKDSDAIEKACDEIRDIQKKLNDLEPERMNEGSNQSQNSQSQQQSQSQGSQGQQSQSQGSQGQQSQSQSSQGNQGQQQGQQSQSQGQAQGSQGHQGQSQSQTQGSQGQQGQQQGSNGQSGGQQGSINDSMTNGCDNIENGAKTGRGKQVKSGISEVESSLDDLVDSLYDNQSSVQPSGANSDFSDGSSEGNGNSDISENGKAGSGSEEGGNADSNSTSNDNSNSGDGDGDFGGEQTSVIYNGKELKGTYTKDITSEVSGNSEEAKKQRLDLSRQTLQAIKTKCQMKEQEKGHKLEKNKSQGSGGSGDLVERYIEFGISIGVDWRVILKNMCHEKRKKTFNIASPDAAYMNLGMTLASRQAIGKPTRISHIKFAVDVSGSVSQKELTLYLSEINNIFKYFDIDGELIYWSTTVGDAGDFSSMKDMLKVKPVTTGGTDVSCVFQYLNHELVVNNIKEEDKPRDIKAIFIITDGYFDMNFDRYAGIFGKKVIWLITENALSFRPPFGRVIQLDNQIK